jgi:hypothetical protein
MVLSNAGERLHIAEPSSQRVIASEAEVGVRPDVFFRRGTVRLLHNFAVLGIRTAT